MGGGLFDEDVSGPLLFALAGAFRLSPLFAPTPTPKVSLRVATVSAPASGDKSCVSKVSITASTTCGGASQPKELEAGSKRKKTPSSAGREDTTIAAVAAAELGAGGGGMILGMFPPAFGAFGS